MSFPGNPLLISMHLGLESESLSVKTSLIANARYEPPFFSRQVSADPTWLRSRYGGRSPSGKVVISRIVPTPNPRNRSFAPGPPFFQSPLPLCGYAPDGNSPSPPPTPQNDHFQYFTRPLIPLGRGREERAIYKPIFSARAKHRKNPIRLTKCKTLLLLLRFSLRAFSIYHGGGGGGGGVRGRGRVINHGFVGEEDGYRGRTEEEE